MTTIKDVAQRAGVSPSTVSRALHDSSLISRDTKEKIWAAMKELNYEPNFAAQNLANSSSNIIGVILPPNKQSVANNPFFSQIIQGITAVCNQQSYLVSIATGKNDHELIKNIKTMIIQGKINKFIVTYSQKSDHVVNFLRDEKVNYVLIGEPTKWENETLYVNNDNVKCGQDATSYLISCGYKTPVFVYSNLTEMVQYDRYIGYSQELQKNAKKTIEFKMESQKLLEKLNHFLETHPEIDSFVVSDDIMAITLQDMLLATNRKSPDYGIISFNNSIFARAAHPSITSIEIFPDSLGTQAAKLILKTDDLPSFDKQQAGFPHVTIPHKIVRRHSTK